MSGINAFYNCTPPEQSRVDNTIEQQSGIIYGNIYVKHIYIYTDKEHSLSFIVPGVKITDIKLIQNEELLTVDIKCYSPFIIDYCEEFFVDKNFKMNYKLEDGILYIKL